MSPYDVDFYFKRNNEHETQQLIFSGTVYSVNENLQLYKMIMKFFMSRFYFIKLYFAVKQQQIHQTKTITCW